MTAILAIVSVLAASAPQAQEKVDHDIYWKIRREATDNSHIMRTLQVLTDLYGPRLTGSPNLKGASEWVVKETTAWGLKNAHLEPWDFGHPGWLNEKLSVHVVSPVKDALVVEALAWTPGTSGAVTAPVARLEMPQRPTKEQLTRFFDEHRADVKGRIAMVGPPQALEVTIVPPLKRRDDNEVKAQFSGERTPGGGQGPPQAARPPADADIVPANQVAEQFDQFLVEAGAVGRVNDAGRDHGQIRAFNNRTFDVAKAVPTVVMRNEDFGRLWRLSAAGQTVELEMNIVNRTYPEGTTQYNVVAEIPGTDKAQEVVMLGGHLDSWHSATGATDNAIGCSTMLEAIRILNAIGVQPRRTIRVA
ncbi:MAG: M28 family peptidase, partial [Acidobacteriota bacterium]|nr:M28 family peptidase [Acidobacteriota bacterium]